MSHTQANLLLLLASLIWGTAFVAQAMGMGHIGPFTFSFARTSLGLLPFPILQMLPICHHIVYLFSSISMPPIREVQEKTTDIPTIWSFLLLLIV